MNTLTIWTWLLIAGLSAILLRTMYSCWRMRKCPQCYWGNLRVLCSNEMREAIKNGNYRTAVRVFSVIHLRCGSCRELYMVRPDFSLERTELPIPAPKETDEERI